jgi:DNA-binding winged helix-turn-helix (wHTH) protein
MKAFGRLATPFLHGNGKVPDVSAMAGTFAFGPFQISPKERLLTRNGAPVTIGGRAFDLLVALIERAGQVVGARQLHNLVWPDVVVEEANLRVCVATLRKALGEHTGEARYIVNVAGRGYAFVAPVLPTLAEEPPEQAVGDEISAAVPARQLPGLLISRNETVDVLSRLLESGCFTRLAVADYSASSIGSPAPSGKDTFGLDAAIFARRPSNVAPSAGHAETGQGADAISTRKLLVVIGRCQNLPSALATISGSLSRASSSVDFLATEREAARSGFTDFPWFDGSNSGEPDIRELIGALDAIGITALPYHAWRTEQGRQRTDAWRRLEELQRENERLRQAISDLTLEKLILKEASLGSF